MQYMIQLVPVLVAMATALLILNISKGNKSKLARYFVGPLFPLIILMATLKHCIWAGLIIFHPEVANITSLHSLTSMASNDWVIFILLGASAASVFGWHFNRRSPFATLFLIPQQFLLFVIAMGAVHAMWTGVFADGTVRTPAFLVADQITTVLLAVLHTTAILETATSRSVITKGGQ